MLIFSPVTTYLCDLSSYFGIISTTLKILCTSPESKHRHETSRMTFANPVYKSDLIDDFFCFGCNRFIFLIFTFNQTGIVNK